MLLGGLDAFLKQTFFQNLIFLLVVSFYYNVFINCFIPWGLQDISDVSSLSRYDGLLTGPG